MFLTTLLKICRTASICSWHNVHQWNFVFLCVLISETTKIILITFHIGIYIKSWYMDFLLVCISQIHHLKSEKCMSSRVSPVCQLINYQSTWHKSQRTWIFTKTAVRTWNLARYKDFTWETRMSVQYTVPVYLSSILQERFQNNFPGQYSGNDGKGSSIIFEDLHQCMSKWRTPLKTDHFNTTVDTALLTNYSFIYSFYLQYVVQCILFSFECQEKVMKLAFKCFVVIHVMLLILICNNGKEYCCWRDSVIIVHVLVILIHSDQKVIQIYTKSLPYSQ